MCRAATQTARYFGDSPDDLGKHAWFMLNSDDVLHPVGLLRPNPWGFFDVYGDRVRVIVTGSSRLEVYRRGGDSLMGRYFLYRMHPFSVAECIRTEAPSAVVSKPANLGDADWNALLRHGGFPEPFLARSPAFTSNSFKSYFICSMIVSRPRAMIAAVPSQWPRFFAPARLRSCIP